jgi:hypothetical protein
LAWYSLVFVGCAPQSLAPAPIAAAVGGAEATPPVEKLRTVYDGHCEAPCPAEMVAALVDRVIDTPASQVTLTLVPHPQPSSQPADQRAAWLCSVEGRPLWMVAQPPRIVGEPGSGITARALARAREFIAEKEELRGPEQPLERPRDWHPPPETLLPAYQSAEYGLQITEIELIDRETESWKITARPIREDTLGGIIWMRFQKGQRVSAEFGR